MLPVPTSLTRRHAVIEVVGAGVGDAVAVGEAGDGPNGMCVIEVARFTAAVDGRLVRHARDLARRVAGIVHFQPAVG